ncbi:hypothetical protein OUZ56_003879 [Daphnia magna]|uniref:Uncharacterized protein n=1 Tax=Daphnia magna TaxID=35525 RepID=A0ABQ9YNG0_9CRUS|nr:hypothetical protein OUZ56_003879 [Daphnia magna]
MKKKRQAREAFSVSADSGERLKVWTKTHFALVARGLDTEIIAFRDVEKKRKNVHNVLSAGPPAISQTNAVFKLKQFEKESQQSLIREWFKAIIGAILLCVKG